MNIEDAVEVLRETHPMRQARPRTRREGGGWRRGRGVKVDYYTPPYVLKAARYVLGRFDLDPGSCEEAQANVRAPGYLGGRTGEGVKEGENVKNGMGAHPPRDSAAGRERGG